ncbi:DUF5641 domain-containing protein [Nephila pilipes]|uniref:DUF5641 domain-containing protein n=1 Tax=Nephila pilipes TaxID=299642 RepID=A0A8X6NDU8_NEPPI|nr:DUF5641 domain-containing protein [Nephila pilipes]
MQEYGPMEGQGNSQTLNRLMTFLRQEVESEEVSSLALDWGHRNSIGDSFSCQIKVLSENKICGYLPEVNDLQVLSEIKEKGIIVPDLHNSANEIDMQLGADVISVILSEKGQISSEILKDLRGRFLKEYLGLLVQKAHKTSRAFKVGEIVLIENPNKKRHYWPLESDDVPLDADAPKIPSANADVSESIMIPVDAPPNMPKVSRHGRTIRSPKRPSVFNVTTVFESE